MGLSEEDKKELKEHTSLLVAELKLNNKKSTDELLYVLRRTRGEIREVKVKYGKLEEENRFLRHQVEILKKEVSDLIGSKRAANMIIHGIEEKVDEEDQDGGKLVQNIIREFSQVGVQLEEVEIKAAERLGQPADNKVRPIMVKLR